MSLKSKIAYKDDGLTSSHMLYFLQSFLLFAEYPMLLHPKHAAYDAI